MLQDENDIWYIFYWGASDNDTSKLLKGKWVDRYLSFEQLAKADLTNLDDIVNLLSTMYKTKKSEGLNVLDWSDGLEDYIYFEGDFSKSVAGGRILKEKTDLQYNLYMFNCMQASIELLMLGTFSNDDNLYKKALLKARKLIIPNAGFVSMRAFNNQPRILKNVFLMVWIYICKSRD